MKPFQRLLIVAALLLFPLPRGELFAETRMAATSQHILKGRISDAGDHPLAHVRVGLRSDGAVAHTDQTGQFTLLLSAGRPLTKGNGDVDDYLELDKDGYLGKTVNIQELSFFDRPLVEKLQPNPVTEDRAEFSTRMSMDYILPPISPDAQFSLISPNQWKNFFASMDSRKKNGFTEQVVFQAYVPKGARKLKAVFLLSHHGIGSIDHPRLRDFANRNGVALVSVNGNPVQRGFYPVSVIDEHIERLGRMLKHTELASLPVITFGHSNGTGFAAIFPSQRPDRVIAWISYHSGGAFHLQFPGIEKVPGLAMHGLIDPFFRYGQQQTVRNLREQRNAPLAMMLEANVAHFPVDKDQNATWDFIAAFCEAAMRIRLADDGTLKPVVIEQGWLGANYDRTQGGQQDLVIAPYAEFEGNRSIANWLPDEEFAKTWQLYGKTDPRPVK
jgi:pimeloyl-ACP methyl ester carboxylesterase